MTFDKEKVLDLLHELNEIEVAKSNLDNQVRMFYEKVNDHVRGFYNDSRHAGLKGALEVAQSAAFSIGDLEKIYQRQDFLKQVEQAKVGLKAAMFIVENE